MCRLALPSFTGRMTNTIDGYPRALTLIAAVGAGLAAGVFFAFSTFVMAALRHLPAPQGIRAMQAINKAAPNPWFMLVLFGTALVCVVLGVSAVRRWGEPAAAWQLAGAALYLVCVVLTMAYHVPRNDALARLDPDAAGAVAPWHHYLTYWTAWNHVRTLSATAGALALTVAMRVG
jgi:uncharacterized membrane protein